MKKQILYFTFIIIAFQFDGFAQTVTTYQSISLRIPDPVITEQKFKNFDHFMGLAREAFIENDYDKTFYYLKTAEKDGIHSGAFWFYLGISVHHRGNESASKRYLKKGFEDFGCWECSEAYEKLYGKKLKF